MYKLGDIEKNALILFCIKIQEESERNEHSHSGLEEGMKMSDCSISEWKKEEVNK